MTRSGYECYVLYLALQRHFSSSYDFFKYNGKVSATTESYRKRNDFYAFEKMAKIIEVEERVNFFVSHFIDNPNEWIRGMSKQKYEEWKNKLKRLPLFYKADLEYLNNIGLSETLKVANDIPLIHKSVISKEINVESIIVLDTLFPFIDNHKEKVDVPFVWGDYIRMVQKYKPFLKSFIEEKQMILRESTKSVLLNK